MQHKITRTLDVDNRYNHYRNIHPMMFEEILHSPEFNKNNYLGAQMFLSFFRNDFPWIYDVGKEVIEILKSKKSRQEKHDAIDKFNSILELSFEHPVFRKAQTNKDMMVMYRELSRFFKRSLARIGED